MRLDRVGNTLRCQVLSLARELLHICFCMLYGTCKEFAIYSPPAADGPELLRRDYHNALVAACASAGMRVNVATPPNAIDVGTVYAARDGFATKGFAMLHYVAKNVRMAPKDPNVALIVDEWLEHHRDFVLPMDMNADPKRYGITGMDASWIEEVHIPSYLSKLEVHLDEHGAPWIGELDSKSMADVVWSITLHRMRSERDPSYFADYPNILQYMCVCDISEDDESDTEISAPEECKSCTDDADDVAKSEAKVPTETVTNCGDQEGS